METADLIVRVEQPYARGLARVLATKMGVVIAVRGELALDVFERSVCCVASVKRDTDDVNVILAVVRVSRLDRGSVRIRTLEKHVGFGDPVRAREELEEPTGGGLDAIVLRLAKRNLVVEGVERVT